MNKKDRKKRYCSECGRILLQIRIGAEKVKEYWGGDLSYPHSPYNIDTGKRQYGVTYKCPKSRWYNWHTNYTELL